MEYWLNYLFLALRFLPIPYTVATYSTIQFKFTIEGFKLKDVYKFYNTKVGLLTVSPLRCKVMQYYWKYIDYKSDKMIEYDRLSQSTINDNTTSPNDASCVVCANSKSFFYWFFIFFAY